jgi:hypothetical protein
MKFDNEAVRNVKALGSYAKSQVKIAKLKVKIGERKRTNQALRNMTSGKGNTYKDSPGMASGVSQGKVR